MRSFLKFFEDQAFGSGVLQPTLDQWVNAALAAGYTQTGHRLASWTFVHPKGYKLIIGFDAIESQATWWQSWNQNVLRDGPDGGWASFKAFKNLLRRLTT